MTTTEPGATTPRSSFGDVSIRTPLWGRVWGVGFGLVWSVLLIVFASRGDGGPLTRVAAPALMVALAATLIFRILVQGIRSEGGQLVVRGPFTRRSVARGDITSVDVGSSPQFPGSSCVVIGTSGGTVIAPPLTTLPFGRRARQQAAGQVAAVRRWAGLASD